VNPRERLGDDQVASWVASHPPWRLHAGHLVREVRTSDYPSAARIVEAQVRLAEGLNHHPVITLGYNVVSFELWTHDRGGLTELDLDYARALDELLAADFAHCLI